MKSAERQAHIANARRKLMTPKEVNIAACLGDIPLGDAPVPAKICSGCERELTPADFGVAMARHDGLQPRCKKCRSSYPVDTGRIHDNNRRYAARNRAWLAERFAGEDCAHCGKPPAGDMRLVQVTSTSPSFRIKVESGSGIAGLEKWVWTMRPVHADCAAAFARSLPGGQCFGHMPLQNRSGPE